MNKVEWTKFLFKVILFLGALLTFLYAVYKDRY